LGINAFPWARVTSIRNADTRQEVAIEQGLVTPAPIDLPPGRYEITLSNPSFGAPVTRVVEIRSGEEETLNVALADAEGASLPPFGGAR
ncbi:MAG TPA: PEGA domain-containing protein, partial [Thermoanaerobaculia bacterium]|nr:PEGA domain-containing protein [Thermoanaerobaculia bacterium]